MTRRAYVPHPECISFQLIKERICATARKHSRGMHFHLLYHHCALAILESSCRYISQANPWLSESPRFPSIPPSREPNISFGDETGAKRGRESNAEQRAKSGEKWKQRGNGSLNHHLVVKYWLSELLDIVKQKRART